jgi:hypothetical protein
MVFAVTNQCAKSDKLPIGKGWYACPKSSSSQVRIRAVINREYCSSETRAWGWSSSALGIRQEYNNVSIIALLKSTFSTALRTKPILIDILLTLEYRIFLAFWW